MAFKPPYIVTTGMDCTDLLTTLHLPPSPLLHTSHPPACIPGWDNLPLLLLPEHLHTEDHHHSPLQEGHLERHEEVDKSISKPFHQWRNSRSDALTYHALVALIVQVVFLPLTVTALIGVAKVMFMLSLSMRSHEECSEEVLDVGPLAGGLRPGRARGTPRLHPLCPGHPHLHETDRHPSLRDHHLPPLPHLVHLAPCLRTSLLEELL